MTQGLLPWSPCQNLLFLRTPLPSSTHGIKLPQLSVSATLETTTTNNNNNNASSQEELSARERRRLRNERRESKAGNNWREEVEERLLKKPKKIYKSWTEELNLDNLAKLGPQWWVVRVSRVRVHETAELIARGLATNFPHIDFKVYAPAIQVKTKLKNGSYSVKPKPLFPGCIFLRCMLNKEIHDFIRECDGVGGFVGSKVGNTKRQINKPRPVSEVDMEAIFRQAKEEQEKNEQAFEEQQQQESLYSGMLNMGSNSDSNDAMESTLDTKPKEISKKPSDLLTNSSSKGKGNKRFTPGSTVRVVSGTFAEFEGSLKKVNRKTGKASVGFTLFGKESLVDLDVNDIVVETK